MSALNDLNDYYDAFAASEKSSPWKSESQKFERNFLSEIVALKRENEDKTYRTSKGSDFILNERGKTRLIHGSKMRDRVVRHLFCDKILGPAMEPYLIENNASSRVGKGLTYARDMFEKDLHNFYLRYGDNDGYVGFMDLSKFYDNIRHDKASEIASQHLDEDARWLFDNILEHFEVDVSYMSDGEYSHCMDERFDSVRYWNTVPDELRTGEKFMRKSVDIGDQVSQNIGIFYPIRMDNYAKIVRGCKWYGRYCDDIRIVHRSKSELIDIMIGLTDIAENELGLFVNKRKTKIFHLSETYKYLQIRYSLTDIGRVVSRIAHETIIRERRRLRGHKRLLDEDRLSYEDIECCYKSWMGNYTRFMSRDQIRNMRALYSDLFDMDPRWK